MGVGKFVMLCFFLTGCAYSYTDADGVDHLIGMMDVATQKNECFVSYSVQTAGVTIDTTKDSGGLNIGYKNLTKVYINVDNTIKLTGDKKDNLTVREYVLTAETLENCTLKPADDAVIY